MLHKGKLIFAVVIVSVSMARLGLFAGWRRNSRLGDLSMTLSLLCRYLPEPAGASVMAIASEMKI